MKIRESFITNSSSASYTVRKNGLSPIQIAILLNPELLKPKYPELFEYAGPESWTIKNKKKKIEFATLMNNFDYKDVFKFLGIPIENIDGESDDE